MTTEAISDRVRGLSEEQLRVFRHGLGRLANEDGARLVAFVKAGSDKELDPTQVRHWLAGQLPDYMIPGQIEQVVSLPRLANGKIDRERLPQSVRVEHGTEKKHVPEPQTKSAEADDAQAKLAALWARNLNTDYVLPEDDFFELGGHSLLGVQLLIDVKEQFGVEIPLADLFEASRLEDMVARIKSSDTAPRVVVTIQRGKDQTPIFSVHGGDKTLASAFGPDRPLYLVFDSISTTSADMSSVEAIAEYYLEGIRAIQPHGPYVLCGYSLGGMIAYEMAMRLTKAGEVVMLVGLFDSTPPDIGRWGLGMRIYQLVSRFGDQKGLRNKVRYLTTNIAGKIARRLRAPTRKTDSAPRSFEEIRDANQVRYFEIGFRYRYPVSNQDCIVYMTDSHPLWVRHLRRKWQRVMRGRLTIECVEGAREHDDITRPPYEGLAARSFAACVTAVEKAVTRAGAPPR